MSGRALPRAAAVSNRRLWIVVGAATAGVVILIAVGVCIAIAFSSGVEPNGPTAHEPIRVDPSGTSKAYRTLKEALQHARANDRIVLAADVQEDDLTVSKVENLTIESAPDRRAVWKTAGRAVDKLLNVSDAPGFHLKGITFDGDGKTHILVQLSGACPGLTLDALSFTGIKTYGLVVAYCDGADGRPAVLSNLSFNTTDDAQTAVYFFFDRELAAPKALIVKDFTFGPKGVHVQSDQPDSAQAAGVGERPVADFGRIPAEVAFSSPPDSRVRRPGLYFCRAKRAPEAGAGTVSWSPWATEIKPRANVLVSPGCFFFRIPAALFLRTG